jgi:hypothetical protein
MCWRRSCRPPLLSGPARTRMVGVVQGSASWNGVCESATWRLSRSPQTPRAPFMRRPVAGARTSYWRLRCASYSPDNPCWPARRPRSPGGTASGGRPQDRVWVRSGRTDSMMPDLPAIAVAEPAPRVIVAQVRGELGNAAPELNYVLGPVLARPLPLRARAGSDRAAVPRLARRGGLLRLHLQTAAARGTACGAPGRDGHRRHPSPDADQRARPAQTARHLREEAWR